jgi:hypothetical protein
MTALGGRGEARVSGDGGGMGSVCRLVSRFLFLVLGDNDDHTEIVAVCTSGADALGMARG